MMIITVAGAHSAGLVDQAGKSGFTVRGMLHMMNDAEEPGLNPAYTVWMGDEAPPKGAHVWCRPSLADTVDSEMNAALAECDSRHLEAVIVRNPPVATLGYQVAHIAYGTSGKLHSLQTDYDLHMHLLHRAVQYHPPQRGNV